MLWITRGYVAVDRFCWVGKEFSWSIHASGAQLLVVATQQQHERTCFERMLTEAGWKQNERGLLEEAHPKKRTEGNWNPSIPDWVDEIIPFIHQSQHNLIHQPHIYIYIYISCIFICNVNPGLINPSAVWLGRYRLSIRLPLFWGLPP